MIGPNIYLKGVDCHPCRLMVLIGLGDSISERKESDHG